MSAELLYIFFIPVYALGRLGLLFSREITANPTPTLYQPQLESELVRVGVAKQQPYTACCTQHSRYPYAFHLLEVV
jgi:hypothetical protein